MSARVIPEGIRAPQERASDPDASVFVAANAGSGKTHVLVQRVIRLLLSGVAPQKILCITFTKAAAANMAQRVFGTLGKWVTLDDAALDAALRESGVKHPDAKMRRRARELFASALDTPGGLKVQTIHALCTRLLQQFPFESNAPARFSVLDERDQTDMMERANLAVLQRAADDPDSAEGRALAVAMASAADVTFRDVVQEACLSRDHFMGWAARSGSADAAIAELSRALDVDASVTPDEIARLIVDGPLLQRSEWPAVAATLRMGTANDMKLADRLDGAAALSGDEQVENYLAVFFTEQKEGGFAPRKSLMTKGLAASYPALATRLADEAARLAPLLQRRQAAIVRERTRALFVIATAVAEHYRREKDARGVLDYEDLIEKTLAMLDRHGSSWVHYKLDKGVDHLLIDEAQDTSPRQWDIVWHIVSEFTSGKGARDGVRRTLFAVGDEKQSIFSFQGAEPRAFADKRRFFRTKFEAAALKFDPVSFTYSFRSGSSVLQSVESTFRDQAVYRSITSDTDGMPPHQALADAAPGLVELWELEKPEERPEMEGWRAPFDAVSETEPSVKLAHRIRDAIAGMIARGDTTGHGGKRRRLRYGDMLVLVRTRGAIFETVIQALKHAGIPVAGADRLKLTEHIAIIDLMHLADAILLDHDELALAVALKSPLFGLDDDDLYKIAWERKGTLRAALSAHADDDPRFAAALRTLEACEAHKAAAPFDFYAWLLGGGRGRAKILGRLGPEANDALDEFLELALTFERRGPATLQGFVTWLRSADTDIKRDLEIARDEVRVMTVHGAKGLEAPVVFLADTTATPMERPRLGLIKVPSGPHAPPGATCMVWAGGKADDPPAVAGARAAMIADIEDEYRRLLYVAMTRAADRLIVGGTLARRRKEASEASWYALIRRGLESSGLDKAEIATPSGIVLRYGRVEDVAADAPGGVDAASDENRLPPWLHTMARPVAAPGVLRPSDSASTASRAAHDNASLDARMLARQRGVLTHRLLQSLPDVPPHARREAAERYLVRNAAGFDTGAQADLIARVLAIIDDPRFAAVFAPGSRAEVPVGGRLKGADGALLRVSGQIDRLAVTDSEVLIVDFKTNRVPPRRAADAPPAYVDQLALYRAILLRIHPGRTVRAALLWSETAEIMEISAEAMVMALGRITSARSEA